MKKKLVVEYWSDDERPTTVPTQYSLSYQEWLCEIMFQNEDDGITEFEIKPDKKMLLGNLIPYIKEQMRQLVPEEAIDRGFRL